MVKFFFISSTFDKHDKTQLLAKFKKILYLGFRATLIFRKFKVALNQFFDTMIIASSDKEWLQRSIQI